MACPGCCTGPSLSVQVRTMRTGCAGSATVTVKYCDCDCVSGAGCWSHHPRTTEELNNGSSAIAPKPCCAFGHLVMGAPVYRSVLPSSERLPATSMALYIAGEGLRAGVCLA